MNINNNKYVILSDVKNVFKDYTRQINFGLVLITVITIIMIASVLPLGKTDVMNLNTCTYEEFLLLDTIGEVKAERFINVRNSVESFNSTTDLLKYDIIGIDSYERIKNKVEVD